MRSFQPFFINVLRIWRSCVSEQHDIYNWTGKYNNMARQHVFLLFKNLILFCWYPICRVNSVLQVRLQYQQRHHSTFDAFQDDCVRVRQCRLLRSNAKLKYHIIIQWILCWADWWMRTAAGSRGDNKSFDGNILNEASMRKRIRFRCSRQTRKMKTRKTIVDG